jgi:hypothetical protein
VNKGRLCRVNAGAAAFFVSGESALLSHRIPQRVPFGSIRGDAELEERILRLKTMVKRL